MCVRLANLIITHLTNCTLAKFSICAIYYSNIRIRSVTDTFHWRRCMPLNFSLSLIEQLHDRRSLSAWDGGASSQSVKIKLLNGNAYFNPVNTLNSAINLDFTLHCLWSSSSNNDREKLNWSFIPPKPSQCIQLLLPTPTTSLQLDFIYRIAFVQSNCRAMIFKSFKTMSQHPLSIHCGDIERNGLWSEAKKQQHTVQSHR